MTYKVVKPGDIVKVTLPFSEVCMHMRVAGDVMAVKVLEHGVQLLNDDGSNYSFPITHGEAGIYTPMVGEWYTDAE